MAGTRLLAQLGFVLPSLVILSKCLLLLNLPQYLYPSHLHHLASSKGHLPLIHNREEGGKQEGGQREWVGFVPATELRVNVILVNNEYHDESETEKSSAAVEDFVFSLEEKLSSLCWLLPKIDIRILSYPHAEVHQAVVSNSLGGSTMSQSTFKKLYSQRNGFNFDYLQRTGLEPACVGACEQVFVVLIRPERSLQPLVMTDTSPSRLLGSESSPMFLSSLIVNKRLILLPWNDRDVLSPSGCFLDNMAAMVANDFLVPLVFPGVDTVRNTSSQLPDPLLSRVETKLVMIKRIKHLERSSRRLLKHIIDLDTDTTYYLRVKKDSPTFAKFETAVRYLDMSAMSPEELPDEKYHFDQLYDQYTALVLATTLLHEVFNDENMVEEVQEDFELLLALTMPYWFPILIPVVYGTAVELKRYYTHSLKDK